MSLRKASELAQDLLSQGLHPLLFPLHASTLVKDPPASGMRETRVGAEESSGAKRFHC